MCVHACVCACMCASCGHMYPDVRLEIRVQFCEVNSLHCGASEIEPKLSRLTADDFALGTTSPAPHLDFGDRVCH